MKIDGRAVRHGLWILAFATSMGCSKSATNAMTESGSAAAASTSAGMVQSGMNIVNQLGGIEGVTKLADAFGLKMAASPILSKIFDAAAITATKLGLVNEIAKVSGMTPPNPGADLASALSGKALDATAVNELNSALSAAADEMHLSDTQKTAVVGVLTPITSSLLGGK